MPNVVVSRSLNLHVMVVDDEALNRRLAQRMLVRLGCTCELLEDGDEVLSALQRTGQVASRQSSSTGHVLGGVSLVVVVVVVVVVSSRSR